MQHCSGSMNYNGDKMNLLDKLFPSWNELNAMLQPVQPDVVHQSVLDVKGTVCSLIYCFKAQVGRGPDLSGICVCCVQENPQNADLHFDHDRDGKPCAVQAFCCNPRR